MWPRNVRSVAVVVATAGFRGAGLSHGDKFKYSDVVPVFFLMGCVFVVAVFRWFLLSCFCVVCIPASSPMAPRQPDGLVVEEKRLVL